MNYVLNKTIGEIKDAYISGKTVIIRDIRDFSSPPTPVTPKKVSAVLTRIENYERLVGLNIGLQSDNSAIVILGLNGGISNEFPSIEGALNSYFFMYSDDDYVSPVDDGSVIK